MKHWLEYLFPRSCCSCGKVWSYLCFECKKELIPHPELCSACHAPSKEFKTCPTCMLEGKTFLDGLLVWFSYQKILKKLILKIKFYHKKDLARFLAERMALLVQLNTYLANAWGQKTLVISYVPSHWYRKYFQKGYNQSELLARHLGALLEVPVLPIFRKQRKTASQVSLSREERFKNLKNAFVCVQSSQLPSGTTLLLVDDVTTTGATLNELAKTLKQLRSDITVRGAVVARNMW